MRKPTISIIAAISENRVIGKNSRIPWHIPEDMKHFKTLTMNHVVIMGRKTYESIGKHLPDRYNIVLTRNPFRQKKGVHFIPDLKEAIEEAKKREQEKNPESPEIFIIGGAQVYQQALPLVNKLYLTVVKGNFKGDAYFPDYSEFKKVWSKQEERSGEYRYTFLKLTRG